MQVSSMRYADDTIIIAGLDIGLEQLTDRLNINIAEFNMKINNDKIKVRLRLSRSQNIPNGKILEQVNIIK